MEKTLGIIEKREVTSEEIERAIQRAQQMRSEALAQLFRQFGGWLRRSLSAVAAWRPWAVGQVFPLNR